MRPSVTPLGGYLPRFQCLSGQSYGVAIPGNRRFLVTCIAISLLLLLHHRFGCHSRTGGLGSASRALNVVVAHYAPVVVWLSVPGGVSSAADRLSGDKPASRLQRQREL